MHLLDIIRYENEHTALDFKAVQYVKGNYTSLLKDVMAMANADTSSDKYIILGVKLLANGTRNILGVGESFVDEATYQQIVSEYIEPELTIRYYPIECDSKMVGVLEILNSNNPPYMMKKAYTVSEKGKSLREGESWIRIGSHQHPLGRKHIDRFISKVIDKEVNDKYFTDELEITLTNELIGDNRLKAELLNEKPSEIQETKIKSAIRKKEESESNISKGISGARFSIFTSPIHLPNMFRTYDERDLETLKNDLRNVKETYLEEDLHYYFELKANKINFSLLNKGKKYLEDASIAIDIEYDVGLMIADKIYDKPEYLAGMRKVQTSLSYDNLHYPSFVNVESENLFRFVVALGDLRHGLRNEVFDVPLRVLVTSNFPHKKLFIKCRVFGKNLLTPRELLLEINII